MTLLTFSLWGDPACTEAEVVLQLINILCMHNYLRRHVPMYTGANVALPSVAAMREPGYDTSVYYTPVYPFAYRTVQRARLEQVLARHGLTVLHRTIMHRSKAVIIQESVPRSATWWTNHVQDRMRQASQEQRPLTIRAPVYWEDTVAGDIIRDIMGCISAQHGKDATRCVRTLASFGTAAPVMMFVDDGAVSRDFFETTLRNERARGTLRDGSIVIHHVSGHATAHVQNDGTRARQQEVKRWVAHNTRYLPCRCMPSLLAPHVAVTLAHVQEPVAILSSLVRTAGHHPQGRVILYHDGEGDNKNHARIIASAMTPATTTKADPIKKDSTMSAHVARNSSVASSPTPTPTPAYGAAEVVNTRSGHRWFLADTMGEEWGKLPVWVFLIIVVCSAIPLSIGISRTISATRAWRSKALVLYTAKPGDSRWWRWVQGVPPAL